MSRCAVAGCASQIGVEGLKWHVFPKSSTRKSAWLRFCGLAESSPTPKHICSRHFPDDAYRLASQMPGWSRKHWRLEDSSVPTLFPPNLQTTQCQSPGNSQVDCVQDIKVPAVESAPEDKCRLCLTMIDAADPNALRLFVAEDKHNNIANDLLNMFQLELVDSPDWPSFICHECAAMIAKMKQFRDTIVASHCLLYNQIVPSHPTMTEDFGNFDFTLDNDEAPAAKMQRKLTRKKRTPELEAQLQEFFLSLKLLNCEPCGLSFDDYLPYENHMKGQHASTSVSVECCGQLRYGRLGILDHLEFHLDGDRYKCSECSAQFDCSSKLNRHKTKDHRSPRFICSQCGKVCLSLSKLRLHGTTHMPRNQRPHKCQYCPKAFDSKASVRRHVERMHEVMARYVCDQCGKAFSNRSTLAGHLDSHRKKKGTRSCKAKSREVTDEEKIRKGLLLQCNICGGYTTSLEGHYKTHGQEFVPTPFHLEQIPCHTCEAMVTRWRMYNHVWRMHEKKECVCTICGQSFRRYSAFQVHMDGHLNRLYPCQHCEKVNNSQQGRYLHIRSHHPEEYQKISRKKWRGKTEIVQSLSPSLND